MEILNTIIGTASFVFVFLVILYFINNFFGNNKEVSIEKIEDLIKKLSEYGVNKTYSISKYEAVNGKFYYMAYIDEMEYGLAPYDSEQKAIEGLISGFEYLIRKQEKMPKTEEKIIQ